MPAFSKLLLNPGGGRICPPISILPSCTLVFKVIPQDATFKMQIFNLGLKTKAISKGKFPPIPP